MTQSATDPSPETESLAPGPAPPPVAEPQAAERPSATEARPSLPGELLAAASAPAVAMPPGLPAASAGKADTERAADPVRASDLAAAPARTPPSPRRPTLDDVGPPSLHDPAVFLNRELTWLNFNWRVLHEAADPRTPLLERVKFLAIVGSNLDEFFMKRIGGLKQQIGAGVHGTSVDGQTPHQQMLDCYALIRAIETRRQELLQGLLGELAAHGIRVDSYLSLDEARRAALRERYIRTVFPLVTPQAMDPAHPFPFVSNLSLNLLVTLRYPNDPHAALARVKVPVGNGIPRLVEVEPGKRTFVPLEEVIANNLDLLFPGMEIDGWELFRVTRNANTEHDEEQADDLLAMIESELRERRLAPIVRLQIGAAMTPLHRGMLAAELGLDEEADVFEVVGMLAVRDLMEIAALDIPALHDPDHHAAVHPALTTDRSIFHVIRDRGSVLLYHPYESFAGSIERFLREASEDPKVRAIKMTLYRTSAKSEVIEALIDAARNGKQVAVALELKARFDEEQNIRWANQLEQVGIHVTYGVVGLKTHCKVTLVVRQDYDGLRRYAHIGTGNYHAGTARIYSDLGLLTCDDGIGQDLTELFNYLTTGYKPKRNYRKLLVAPKLLKGALLDKIEREIAMHSAGSPGLIQLKMNALEDVDITRALYRAAQAGVCVDLVVRDTCRLRPGIPGLSERVRVISIVGRFLEHARIFYFKNGGTDEYYIGSADAMKRNLESRVEVLVPVETPSQREVLRFILDTQLDDQRSAWDMCADGSYTQRAPPDRGKRAKSSQEQFIDWAERRNKDATRLRRRTPQGVARRRPR
jgi:polyphosphate kinase